MGNAGPHGSLWARRLGLLALLGAPFGCTGGVTSQPLFSKVRPADACTHPTPLMSRVDGVQHPTGQEHCGGLLRHRAEAVACVQPAEVEDGRGSASQECEHNADCAARPLGFCDSGRNMGSWCAYRCETDEDCEAGELCDCSRSPAVCVAASCRTDADCEGDYLCARVGLEWACHSPKDECRDWNDCKVAGSACADCVYAHEKGHRVCEASDRCDE